MQGHLREKARREYYTFGDKRKRVFAFSFVRHFREARGNHKEFRTRTTKYWLTQDKSAGTTVTNFLRLALTRKVDGSRALLRLTLSSRETLNAASRRPWPRWNSNSPTLDRTLNGLGYQGAFVSLSWKEKNYGKLRNFSRPEIRKVRCEKIDMPREDISCERQIEQVR